MSIINKIIELAEEKSITQQAICDALGIQSGTFSTWKARETDPPAKYIACICETLGVSTEYLLTGKEKSPKSELTETELEMLEKFRHLLDIDKGRILGEMGEIYKNYSPEQKENVS